MRNKYFAIIMDLNLLVEIFLYKIEFFCQDNPQSVLNKFNFVWENLLRVEFYELNQQKHQFHDIIFVFQEKPFI